MLGRKGSDEWYTPPYIFDSLKLEFDLDPCMPIKRIEWIPTWHAFTKDDNGLVQSWDVPPKSGVRHAAGALVWLNPPYGEQSGAWMRKLIDHGEGVALTFARTDVQWFQVALQAAWNACFIQGRVNFVGADGKVKGHAAAPSVLLAYGLRASMAVSECGLGTLVIPTGRPHGDHHRAEDSQGRRSDGSGVRRRRRKARAPNGDALQDGGAA